MSVSRLALAAIAALALAACNKPGGKDAKGLPELKPSEVPASVAELDKQVASAAVFVDAAAQANLLQTETSRMALQRAQNPDVKAFAQRIVEQHSTHDDALFAAAGGAAIALPADKLDEAHLRSLNDLETLEGAAAFDAAYVKLIADSLQESVRLHESFARDGKIDQVKAYAADVLQLLKDDAARAAKLL